MKTFAARLSTAVVLVAALPFGPACSDAGSSLEDGITPPGYGGVPGAATGGVTSTGGVVATGGSLSTGGVMSTGGTSSTGGSASSGGASTGGSSSSGGASTGGSTSSGGTSMGGTTSSGGSSSTGGTGTGGAPPTATGGAGGHPFANFKPKPDQPKECPALAPENPFGDCLGKPIYLGCGWSDGTRQYNCVCDWYHWICL